MKNLPKTADTSYNCICVSISSMNVQGMVLSAVNGVGLSLVIPNAQSITADYYDELDRGKAFGALYMTSAMGGAIGSLYATNQGKQIRTLHCIVSLACLLYTITPILSCLLAGSCVCRQ